MSSRQLRYLSEPCCGRRTWQRPSDSYPQRGDPAMSKSKSLKPSNKATKPKKGTKPADLPEVQLPAPTEPRLQPDTAVASEPPAEAIVPPAPETAATEPAAVEIAPEPTNPAEAEPEPAPPAQTRKAPTEAKPKKAS